MTSIFPSENGNASGSFCLGQIFARACHLVQRTEEVNRNDKEDKGVIQKQRERTERITNCKGAAGERDCSRVWDFLQLVTRGRIWVVFCFD